MWELKARVALWMGLKTFEDWGVSKRKPKSTPPILGCASPQKSKPKSERSPRSSVLAVQTSRRDRVSSVASLSAAEWVLLGERLSSMAFVPFAENEPSRVEP